MICVGLIVGRIFNVGSLEMEVGVGLGVGVESGCVGCEVDVEVYFCGCFERWRVGWNVLRWGIIIVDFIVFFK